MTGWGNGDCARLMLLALKPEVSSIARFWLACIWM
jgi:hypothetical protein